MRCMCLACCISKATDAHSEYVVFFCFSMVTIVSRRRFNITSNIACLMLFVSNLASGFFFQLITHSEDFYHVCLCLILCGLETSNRQPRPVLGCKVKCQCTLRDEILAVIVQNLRVCYYEGSGNPGCLEIIWYLSASSLC